MFWYCKAIQIQRDRVRVAAYLTASFGNSNTNAVDWQKPDCLVWHSNWTRHVIIWVYLGWNIWKFQISCPCHMIQEQDFQCTEIIKNNLGVCNNGNPRVCAHVCLFCTGPITNGRAVEEITHSLGERRRFACWRFCASPHCTDFWYHSRRCKRASYGMWVTRSQHGGERSVSKIWMSYCYNWMHMIPVKVSPHHFCWSTMFFSHISNTGYLGTLCLWKYSCIKIYITCCFQTEVWIIKFNKCGMTSFQVKQLCVDAPALLSVSLQAV